VSFRRDALIVGVALALTACGGGGSGETPSEGEVGSEELALVPPEGWLDRGDELDQFVVIYDAPGETYGRVGALRGEGVTDVEAYVADTSEVGAELRGLEPETLERGPVDVEGAAEAFEIEFTSAQPTEGDGRTRTLQLAVRRTDDVLFDVRVEMAEEAWDAELARGVVDSVRLIDPPS
jgi:hypothetical protein